MGSVRVWLVVLMASLLTGAQQVGAQGTGTCGVSPVVAADARPNIFSVQQEAWLGEAYRDILEREYLMINDPAMNSHLQMIVDRLVANLPEPHVHFRAILIEDSEVNGFSIAGGSIYITRKLAATVKNDDELAGVLGHEIGHIASHQFMFENTADMKRLLHVTKLGDRNDVYTKFQELVDAQIKEARESHANDDVKQDEADRIGVYLIAAAGYRPDAFPEWWDRVLTVKGKTGGKLGDFFGVTTTDQKRLRGMRQTAAALPATCVAKTASASETSAFQQWQKLVIENRARVVPRHELAANDVKLTPPLQMEIDRVRFSPDGKLLLAQDEGSVYVVTTDTLKVKVKADAEGADAAFFTPDSSRVTFTTPGLHTEEWSVTDGKMVAAHEPLSKDFCVEAKLSPDGRTVICLSFDREWFGGNLTRMLNLSLLDAATGDVVFEKRSFFEPTRTFAFRELEQADRRRPSALLESSFSSDGNTLLIGPGVYKLAFDLRTRTPIKVGGALKSQVTGPYAFLGNNRVAGESALDAGDSGVYSFPDGKRIQKLGFELPDMGAVADPGDKVLVLTGQIPPKNKKEKQEKTDVKVRLADLGSNASLMASRTFALDVWKDDFAIEGADGSMFLGKLSDADGKQARRVPMPIGNLGGLYAVATSPDGKWIAYSTRDRSGVWDMQTGKRFTLMHPFDNVRWTSDGLMYAEFPKSTEYERKALEFDLAAKKTRELDVKLNDDTRMRFGYMTQWKTVPTRGTQLTVYHLKDNSVAWTRNFPDVAPKMTGSFGGRDFILAFPLSSSTAKDVVSSSAVLIAEVAALKGSERSRLVQLVNAETGVLAGEIVVEVPRDFEGVHALDYADGRLYVGGAANRTLVYAISDGSLAWQTFGRVVAVEPTRGLSCVVNRRDELTIFDAQGKELQHLQTGSPVRYVEFLDGGRRMLVLMADQTVRMVNVGAAAETKAGS